MHLAAALFWQEMLGEPVTIATYDRQLWDAPRSVGMYAFAELPLMCILHGKLLQQRRPDVIVCVGNRAKRERSTRPLDSPICSFSG